MTVTWACRLSVAEYAALGRRAPAPRSTCSSCDQPMAFDGAYPRFVREGGVVHTIFVRRAYCRPCDRGEALVPDFVLARRLDSTATIGAALLQDAGVELPDGATDLYREVPSRTLRSWRQRFAERADELAAILSAFCAAWGGLAPRSAPTALGRATESIGAAWRAARRRWDVPAAFILANVVLGGQLLSNRVDLPVPDRPGFIGRSRAP